MVPLARHLPRAPASRPAERASTPALARRGLATSTVGRVTAFLHTPTWPGGLPVDLDEVTAEVARARLRNEVLPRIPVGGTVVLRLAHDTGAELRLEAKLVELHELPVARLLVLRWSGDRSVFTDPELARLFDRRIAVRVVPAPAEPVRVALALSDREPARLEVGSALDLSTGGLAIEVSAAFDRAAVRATTVTCRLRLPGARLEHPLRARIAHRVWAGDGRVRYSLSFELTTDPMGRRTHADLLAYVVERQRALRSATPEGAPEAPW